MDQDFYRLIFGKQAGQIFENILLFSISRRLIPGQLIKIRKKLKTINYSEIPGGKDPNPWENPI